MKIYEIYNQEKNNPLNKDYNKWMYKFWTRRSKSKYNGKEFNLSFMDFFELEKPLYCPLLGLKINYTNKKIQDDSPSIDRIQNSKGYTKDNVWIISNRANRIKSDSTPGELMQIALNLRKKLQSG